MILPVLAGLAGLSLMGNPPKRKRRKARRRNPSTTDMWIKGGEDGGDCDIVIEATDSRDNTHTYYLPCDTRAAAKRLIQRGPAAVQRALEKHRNLGRNPKMPWQRKGAGRWGRKHGVLVWIPAKRRKVAKRRMTKQQWDVMFSR